MSDEIRDNASGLSDDELRAATPRGTGGREAQLGLFVLLGLSSFIVVLFTMTDPATFRDRYFLVTRVENAGGIRDGDPVQMHGVNLGRVNEFEMIAPGVVDIKMEIEGKWDVPIGSHTRFGAAGMFGGRTLEIVASNATTYHADGDTLPGESAVSEGLFGAIDDMTMQAQPILEGLQNLLNEETVGSVQGSLSQAQTLFTELAALAEEQRAALGEITASLSEAAEGIGEAAEAGPDIASAIARADSTMAVLAETAEAFERSAGALEVVLTRIEQGEGTLGKLSTDPALYDNVNEASALLAAFLIDFQENPNKYINISIF